MMRFYTIQYAFDWIILFLWFEYVNGKLSSNYVSQCHASPAYFCIRLGFTAKTISVLHVCGWYSLKLQALTNSCYLSICREILCSLSTCLCLPKWQSYPWLPWLVNIKLNCPPKPEKSQKIANCNGKNHTLPGIQTQNRTTGIALLVVLTTALLGR
jgi:hypothetical protein